MGSRFLLYCQYGVFLAGDRRWILLAPSSEESFRRLSVVLGIDERAEFSTIDKRWRNRVKLNAMVARKVRKWRSKELEKSLIASEYHALS